jgi:hypothetical protein
MKLANFTLDQLKVLPLRAIVAFAARCARRVEPLAQLPAGDPQRESRRKIVEAALRMAEEFARGADVPPDETVITAIDAARDAADESTGSSAVSAAAQAAHAAASAWHAYPSAAEESPLSGQHATRAGNRPGALSHVTADLAALNAFTAAAGAFMSVGYHNEDFVDYALRDYETLIRLNLGQYPETGAPVDSSSDGPLGPL